MFLFYPVFWLFFLSFCFFLSLSPLSVSQLQYLSFFVALLQVVGFNVLIQNVILQ